jgi:cysteine dioxygenase
MQVEVRGVVDTLRTVPPPRFQPVEICKLLADANVNPKTLEPYLHFAKGRYTRNLIFRNELFELIALCWSPKSQSPIHNHSNQLCWLSIQSGALRLENFSSLDGPGPGERIRLVPSGGLARAAVGCLDLQQGDDGIHRVSNPFDEPAVSLHVYSRPYDICLGYDLVKQTASELELRYWSIDGKLVQQ